MSLRSTPTPQDLSQQCLITSYKLQTHGIFLDSYLPGPRGATRLPTNSIPGVSGAWLSTTYNLSLTDDLLSDALSALSLAYIERQDEGDPNLFRSRAMYGRAMRKLSRKLNDDNEMVQDATLAAVMALTAYEVSDSTKFGRALTVL